MWSPGSVRGGESAIPQQHNKEGLTGATSCPQAAKEAKLCQVAAHPAADAKHSSVFSICVSAETLRNCGLFSQRASWTSGSTSEDKIRSFKT